MLNCICHNLGIVSNGKIKAHSQTTSELYFSHRPSTLINIDKGVACWKLCVGTGHSQAVSEKKPRKKFQFSVAKRQSESVLGDAMQIYDLVKNKVHPKKNI